MKKWKKILNWGLGGLALGAAAVWARKSRAKVEKAVPIPDDIEKVVIETERLEVRRSDDNLLSRHRYSCTPTRFRVWSFLRSEPGASVERGLRIFHVIPEVIVDSPAAESDSPEVFTEERFYATIHIYSPGRREPLPGHVARGCLLEFHKCHVGGSLNGVETGEKIVTMSPVSDFAFVQADELAPETAEKTQ